MWLKRAVWNWLSSAFMEDVNRSIERHMRKIAADNEERFQENRVFMLESRDFMRHLQTDHNYAADQVDVLKQIAAHLERTSK